MPTNNDHLLTKDDVARLLRLSVRTIERMEAKGELQPVRIGRSVRYLPGDVEAVLTRRSAS